MTTKKTIAQELEDRLFYLADPTIKWVQHYPSWSEESCLIRNGSFPHSGFSPLTLGWLYEFTSLYSGRLPSRFNDHVATSREEVLWMLEEAIDQAKWEGV